MPEPLPQYMYRTLMRWENPKRELGYRARYRRDNREQLKIWKRRDYLARKGRA